MNAVPGKRWPNSEGKGSVLGAASESLPSSGAPGKFWRVNWSSRVARGGSWQATWPRAKLWRHTEGGKLLEKVEMRAHSRQVKETGQKDRPGSAYEPPYEGVRLVLILSDKKQ